MFSIHESLTYFLRFHVYLTLLYAKPTLFFHPFLILEIPGGRDVGANAPVTIFVPSGLKQCPMGTS
jgi:hypothetical protein